nr:MAG TPA: hypothetical protein [Caudoviricetes sp.]
MKNVLYDVDRILNLVYIKNRQGKLAYPALREYRALKTWQQVCRVAM